ncbi:hypothetical protein H2204_005669 [Knufia peltigerae]|uniref:NAD(P)-binding protein n=1 Tax=Knufia peltigerae TaxID=1002370 RepID=A0AA39CXD4_9EURO|nr:hypothetical protein H2204_005669 [Knufia peltigerae]
MSRLNDFGGLFRLDSKVAVITGGSRGIGLHTATAFLQAGAERVILVARKLEGPQGLLSALGALHSTVPGCRGRVSTIACDLSKFSEVQRLAKEIEAITCEVHILVANAGATWGGPLETTPDASISKVLDLNVRSIINLARLLAPLLIRTGIPQDPARIIIIGAIAGFTVPFTGENSTIVYSVSKAAAHHLARNLAMEYGPQNVTCNCVAPGFFPTKLSNGLIDIFERTKMKVWLALRLAATISKPLLIELDWLSFAGLSLAGALGSQPKLQDWIYGPQIPDYQSSEMSQAT